MISVWPSVCWWNAVAGCKSIPLKAAHACKWSDINKVSLSNMIVVGYSTSGNRCAYLLLAYYSALKLSELGIRNLYPLWRLTMVHICEMYPIWSLSISMLAYIVEHLMKTAVNLRTSIQISVYGPTGTWCSVTRCSGSLFPCSTSWQVSQLATNECTSTDKDCHWYLSVRYCIVFSTLSSAVVPRASSIDGS